MGGKVVLYKKKVQLGVEKSPPMVKTETPPSNPSSSSPVPAALQQEA